MAADAPKPIDPEPSAETGRPWSYRPAADAALPPLERIKSVQREPGLFSAIVRQSACWTVERYLRLYHRMEVTGREHVPLQTPLVLAANHQSHLDALMLATCLPLRLRSAVFPIAAGDTFFTTPASAVFASLFINALPMWRKSVGAHAMSALRNRLASGDCGFILFPEGTRSRDGRLNAFKPGLGMLIAGTSVPVVPCWIEGAFEALPADKRLPRPRKLGVRIGPPLTFAAESNDRPGWTRIVQQVEAAVRGLGGVAEEKSVAQPPSPA